MAKVTGVFTGVKGKVGNVVYSTWKGIQIMKTRSIPANPRSTGQVLNRGNFTKLIAIGRQLTGNILPQIWNDQAGPGKSGWGNFLSKNLSALANDTYDHLKLIFSYGPLYNPGIMEALLVGDSVTVDFSNSLVGDSQDNDFCFAIIYDNVSDSVVVSDGSDYRSDSPMTLDKPSTWVASNLTAYLVFYRDNEVEECIGSSPTTSLQVTTGA